MLFFTRISRSRRKWFIDTSWSSLAKLLSTASTYLLVYELQLYKELISTLQWLPTAIKGPDLNNDKPLDCWWVWVRKSDDWCVEWVHLLHHGSTLSWTLEWVSDLNSHAQGGGEWTGNKEQGSDDLSTVAAYTNNTTTPQSRLKIAQHKLAAITLFTCRQFVNCNANENKLQSELSALRWYAAVNPILISNDTILVQLTHADNIPKLYFHQSPGSVWCGYPRPGPVLSKDTGAGVLHTAAITPVDTSHLPAIHSTHTSNNEQIIFTHTANCLVIKHS